MAFEANGWLYLKNKATDKRVKVPATVSVRSRNVEQGEPERLSIEYYSPETDMTGDWDSQRKAAWLKNVEDDVKAWQPAGFALADSKLRSVLEAKCLELLANAPLEEAKGIAAERRIKRIRFDDVLVVGILI